MAALAMAFAGGILAAAFMSSLGWFALAAVCVVAACIAWRERARATAIILGAVFVIGAWHYSLWLQVSPDDISRAPSRVISFEGIVAADPDVRPDQTRVIINAQRAKTTKGWCDVTGQVMVTLRLPDGAQSQIAYGDRVWIGAHPYTPFPPTNPGQFSWKDYLARKGIHSCASVEEISQIKRLGDGSGNILVKSALAAKHYVARSIETTHPKPEASVVVGMVLGTYSALPKDTIENFGRTGTLHLLAASGYNCLILLLLVNPILRLMQIPRKWQSIIIVTLLVLYVMMIGSMPSMIRAAIMCGLWALAMPLKRVPNIKNLFFTAALVTLALRPSDLFDVGFQLSFVAVWALITSSSLIESVLMQLQLIDNGAVLKRKNTLAQKIKRELVSTAVATITVTLYTAPIVAYYFNYVSLVSLPANIALALCVPIVFAVGLASTVAVHIPYLGSAVGFVGARVTDFMLAIVNYLGSGEYSAVDVASPGVLAIVGYYILLFTALKFMRSKYA